MTSVATWLMVAIAFISLVLTVLVPLLVTLFNAHKNTAKELSSHQTHVAETYATKHDVKELGDRMERQLKDGITDIKELINNRNTA